MGFFTKAWKGEERLWKVWWLFGVPLNILGTIFDRMSAMKPPPMPLPVFSIIGLVMLGVWVFWCISAWRCAPNVDSKSWMYIARALIVVGVLGTVASIAVGFRS